MIDQKIRGYIMQLTLVLINDFYLDQLFEAVFEITQKDVAIFTGKQPQNCCCRSLEGDIRDGRK